MIDPKATVTYAQYNEDVVLGALLHDVTKGFYIDVGANYPTIDSVTKYFYDQGWSGINIEPIESLYKQLVAERSRDVNLHAGLGEKAGTLEFREYTKTPGHSTFQTDQKEQHSENHKDYEVKVLTLKQVFENHKPAKVHFIKIDVEGFEYQVVAGNDWKKYRPEVICIEANHVSNDWRPLLLKNDYKLFIQDGLNEYYLAGEAWQRTKGFEERVVSLDYHALKQHQYQSWSADSQELVKLTELIQKEIPRLQAEVSTLRKQAALSLSNQPLRRRIKRAAYGLTVDWLRYKKR